MKTNNEMVMPKNAIVLNEEKMRKIEGGSIGRLVWDGINFIILISNGPGAKVSKSRRGKSGRWR